MYYFVREACGSPHHFARTDQGFATELNLTSEMLQGRISIDGLYNKDIFLGETFRVRSLPEYQLKGIRFIV